MRCSNRQQQKTEKLKQNVQQDLLSIAQRKMNKRWQKPSALSQ